MASWNPHFHRLFVQDADMAGFIYSNLLFIGDEAIRFFIRVSLNGIQDG